MPASMKGRGQQRITKRSQFGRAGYTQTWGLSGLHHTNRRRTHCLSALGGRQIDRRATEVASVKFIAENDGGPGARACESSENKNRHNRPASGTTTLCKTNPSPVQPNLIRRESMIERGQNGSQSIHPRHLPRSRTPGASGQLRNAPCQTWRTRYRYADAISPRARKAIEAAAKRVPRGTGLSDRHWQRVIVANPLIIEALQKQEPPMK